MRYRVNHDFVVDQLYPKGSIIDLAPEDAAGANAVQPGLLTAVGDDDLPLVPERRGALPVLRMEDVTFNDDDFVLRDAFMPPYRGEKHLYDLPVMCHLARTLNPNHILEFGTAYGNSARNLANHIPDAQIYTVNALPEQINGVNITQAFTMEEIGRVFRDTPEAERIHQVYADTASLTKKQLGIKSAEMVIIDGCHDYGYVISDFALALRMLPSTNSIIMIHDALPDGPFPEIHDALVHLRSKGHDIRLIEHTSWAIYVLDFMASPWDVVFEEVTI